MFFSCCEICMPRTCFFRYWCPECRTERRPSESGTAKSAAQSSILTSAGALFLQFSLENAISSCALVLFQWFFTFWHNVWKCSSIMILPFRDTGISNDTLLGHGVGNRSQNAVWSCISGSSLNKKQHQFEVTTNNPETLSNACLVPLRPSETDLNAGQKAAQQAL